MSGKRLVSRQVALLMLLWLVLLAVGIVRAQGGGTIGYGSTLFGRVTAEMPQVLYSFNGAVGDLITVKLTSYSGGLDPRVTLLGPAQQPLVVNDRAPFRTGPNEAYITAFLPATGTYGLLIDSANGQPGDFMLELRGRTPVQATELEMGVPVRVDVPDEDRPQYFTFEADPFCPTTLTVYDISRGQPATFPFVVKVRDEDGVEVALLRGGRVLENRLTVAPDGDPNPGTEMYEVEVGSADGVSPGSLVLVITCADDAPDCLDPGGSGTVATAVPTIDPNGTPTPTWTPPGGDPCIDVMWMPTLTPTMPVITIAEREPVAEIAGEPDMTPTRDLTLGGLGDHFPDADEAMELEATRELLVPILPDPPSINLNPTANPSPTTMPTPCPTWTPTPPGHDPCLDPTPGISIIPSDPVVVVAREELAEVTGEAPAAEPLIILGRMTTTPTATPCPTATPTATPTRPPSTQPDCAGFKLTSPTDGLPNGGVTVYWDPVAWATSYRVNVFGEGGSLLLSVEVAAPATSVGIDVSVGNIGPGFIFTIQVQALQAGVVRCTDSRTLFRESPGGDPGGDPGDDPRDDPGGDPEPRCTPALTHVNC